MTKKPHIQSELDLDAQALGSEIAEELILDIISIIPTEYFVIYEFGEDLAPRCGCQISWIEIATTPRNILVRRWVDRLIDTLGD